LLTKPARDASAAGADFKATPSGTDAELPEVPYCTGVEDGRKRREAPVGLWRGIVECVRHDSQ
jgi:hypothetical protein